MKNQNVKTLPKQSKMFDKNRIIAWMWRWSNSKAYSADEEDFEEFLKEYKERLNKIKEVYHPKDYDELKHIALSFHNNYTQREMVNTNKSLQLATWILAIATILFTVSEIWGSGTANNVTRIMAQFVLGFFILFVVGSILSILITWIKRAIKWLILKKPHIFCSQCGRIIFEYEEEGDKKPAITLCPECLRKKG